MPSMEINIKNLKKHTIFKLKFLSPSKGWNLVSMVYLESSFHIDITIGMKKNSSALRNDGVIRS